MTIRLYFDDDAVWNPLVAALRARGVDVLTANEASMAGQVDEAHIAYAAKSGRVLCSFNRSDFYRIHTEYLTEGRSHAGLILAPQQRYSVGEYLRRIVRLMAAKSADEMRNQVEFLGAWGER